MRSSKDWAQFTVNLPMTTTPGTAFSYCSPSPHLVSAILTRATGKSARDLANKWLFDPLGIPYLAEGFWPSDPQGISDGCCGAYLTPRNMAKLGLLWLQGGQWAGRQIVSRGWIAAAGTGHVTWQPGRDYGYLFWVYPAQGYFSAMGTGGQHIHVIPAKNMVVVFTAGESFEGQDKMTALMDQYIIPAARSAAPLPANVQGLADLQARVRRAAEPKVKPGSLPEMAKKVSGVSYALKGSSAGWKTVVFKFEEGSDVAMVTLNGELGLMIGLDNVYRLTSLPGNTYAGLRGRWTDASTFVVDDITLGELEQTELKVAFAGDSLAMTVHEKVWGWTEEVSGK